MRLLSIMNPLLLAHCGFSQYHWKQLADFPVEGRRGSATFVIGGYAYVVGGVLGTADYSNDMWRYDPCDDSWLKRANFPPAVAYAGGVAVNGKGYVICGISAGNQIPGDLWEYDPVVDTWTSKAPYPGYKSYHTLAFASSSYLYAGLGRAASIEPYSNQLWRYSPATDLWLQMTSLPGPGRTISSATQWNGNGYVVGGATGNGTTLVNEIWEYNVAMNSWGAHVHFPKEIEGVAVGVHRGALVVSGGTIKIGGIVELSYETYMMTATDSLSAQSREAWTQLSNYTGQSGYTSTYFSIHDTMYLGMGYVYTPTGKYVNDFWRLDADALPYSSALPMFHNAVLAGAIVVAIVTVRSALVTMKLLKAASRLLR